MGMFLNKTGRQILYSCEWPLYDYAHKHAVIVLFFLCFCVSVNAAKPIFSAASLYDSLCVLTGCVNLAMLVG